MDGQSEHDDATKRYPSLWLSKPELWFKLKDIARDYRYEMTKAEKTLWAKLRNKGLGVKFRRQHTIERFIVDFICTEKKLIVEVDGEVHRKTVERDEIRDEFLASLGFTVLHFWNDEVLTNINAVIKKINQHLDNQRSA
jgi:very-short-patch-repair endonuclease